MAVPAWARSGGDVGGGNVSQLKASEIARIRNSYVRAFTESLEGFLGAVDEKIHLGVIFQFGGICRSSGNPLGVQKHECRLPRDLKIEVMNDLLEYPGDHSEYKIAITEKSNNAWVTKVSAPEWERCQAEEDCRLGNPLHEFLVYKGVESNLDYTYSSEFRRSLVDGNRLDVTTMRELSLALDRALEFPSENGFSRAPQDGDVYRLLGGPSYY